MNKIISVFTEANHELYSEEYKVTKSYQINKYNEKTNNYNELLKIYD